MPLAVPTALASTQRAMSPPGEASIPASNSRAPADQGAPTVALAASRPVWPDDRGPRGSAGAAATHTVPPHAPPGDGIALRTDGGPPPAQDPGARRDPVVFPSAPPADRLAPDPRPLADGPQADAAPGLRPGDALAPPRGEPPVTQAALPAALDTRVRTMIEQISTRPRQASEGSLQTEIELSPAELGRLRIVLRDTAQGLHIQIAADRPETLDLVRRHVDGLQRALASDGAVLAGLDLSGGGTARRFPGAPQNTASAAPDGDTPTAAAPVAAVPSSSPSGGSRLDIRL
ncbi:flagellar hook-length control protein FliK [Jannaschia formosa]|uniref:flagellar hook-length control protein FliK n=1 Tax=Jannaschia formosa TaxID=2259592 RepID=UPI00142FC1F8|nr:flagellar hook-length control protein FliK [Jannaschia formosa]